MWAPVSWPPSRDVVPEARHAALRLVVPEARRAAQRLVAPEACKAMAREARGSGGLPPGQQSLAARTPQRRLGLRRAGGSPASGVRRSARRLRRDTAYG